MPQGDLRRPLMRWYRLNGRHTLPWRLTRDPYAVLVSELMLQQTQVDRVLPYYERWLSKWPTVATLAAASAADVIREWAGLGYNRRALYLHRAAIAVDERHGGRFPAAAEALRALPGVGPYTAAAIASFAYRKRVAVTDTNIARVLARAVLGAGSAKDLPASQITCAADRLLPGRNARDHNLALMDLGATVCTARAPSCDVCPVRGRCAWLAAGAPPSTIRLSPSPAFASTARFARGRIIDTLRQSEGTDADTLTRLLPASHQPHLLQYLEGLERDGLVVAREGVWSLPT